MELTPDLLLEARFTPAKRGYNMAEVDDFLERCAEGLDVLLDRLKSEYERAERAEAALTERPTEAVPAAVAREPEPAPEPEPESEPERAPEPVVAPAAPAVDVDEPMRVLVMAERTAEAAVREAKEEAERIRSEAEAVASSQRSEAERLLSTARSDAEAEARRAAEGARREIEQEMNTLRRDRDGLNSDVRNLHRWLDEQRGRMRTTVREMNRLIEDPTALREIPVPDLSRPGESPAGDPASGDPASGDTTADVSGQAGDTAGNGGQDAPSTEALWDDDLGAGEPTKAVPAVDIADDEPTTGPGQVNF